MSETELKFGVPVSSARAIDASLRKLGGRVVSIESRYFDTVDGTLTAAGVSLRLRRIGRRWEQTVKAPGRHAADRLEETVPLPGPWGTAGPALDPTLHDGTRAGAALRSALKPGRDAPAVLVHRHTSVVKRRFVEVDADDDRVEIAFDRGSVVVGAHASPICELEIERKAGDPKALIGFARAGIEAHAMWSSTISKAQRGDALARHAGKHAAARAQQPSLPRGMGAAALRRAAMRACIDQVGANASILAEGQLDDEVVHQLRVGLRRLRTAARELPRDDDVGPPPSWEPAITDLFGRLGDYRDRSIVADSIGHELAAAGSPSPLLRPAREKVDPVALVRGRAFQLAWLELLAESMGPPADDAEVASGGGRDIHGAIAARLGKLHAALTKAARRFAHLGDVERHRVRKRLKRLRYFAELVGPLYDARAVDRYLARLRPAQDALGAYVDIVVGIRLAHDSIEAGDARGWFNVGWLTAQLPSGVRRCRKALADAASARPFWVVD